MFTSKSMLLYVIAQLWLHHLVIKRKSTRKRTYECKVRMSFPRISVPDARDLFSPNHRTQSDDYKKVSSPT